MSIDDLEESRWDFLPHALSSENSINANSRKSSLLMLTGRDHELYGALEELHMHQLSDDDAASFVSVSPSAAAGKSI